MCARPPIMAPSMYISPDIPSSTSSTSSTSLTPTTDNRTVPPRKSYSFSSHTPTKSTFDSQVDGKPLRVKHLRPLTVNEALQYSPLSSIVPFDSSIIPLPNANLPTSQPLFSDSSSSHIARRPLDLIERDLTQGHGRPALAEHAIGIVRSLLNGDSLTEFKFKIPSRIKGEKPEPNSAGGINGHSIASPRLGHFANMVLNATNVAYRYPTPTSDGVISPKNLKSPSPQLSREPATPISPPLCVSSGNARPQIGIQPEVPEQLSSSQNAKLRPMVVVPPLPHSSDPNLYKVFPENQQASFANSRKRKRDHLDTDNKLLVQNKDTRAASQAALNSLQELLAEIFEAEANSHLQHLDSSSSSEWLLYLLDDSDGTSLTLTVAAHVKIESCLHKAITLGRFRDVPADHLCQLLKLCEGTIFLAGTSDISVAGLEGDEYISQWLDNIEKVETGLRSARTVLRIMTGGREEKQIYPEELLQRILSLLSKVMDSCIIPVVESRSSESQTEVFQLAASNKKSISQLLHAASKIMQLVSELIVRVDLAEGTITTVEFLMIQLLFVENAPSEKDSVLGIHKYETFRRTAMDIIAETFLRYTEQRTFILREIPASLQKLPTTRQHARQFKLGDGKSIQLVSALIMRLVQTSAVPTRSRSINSRGQKLVDGEASSPDVDPTESDEASDGEDTRQPPKNGIVNGISAASLAIRRQANEAKSLYGSAITNAKYVINILVARASSASKTGDQPHRHLLDIFVEDLLNVLGLPEWPAAELLLQALVAQLNDIVTSDKSTAPAKNMGLELFGMMGCAISDITSATQNLAKTLENDESTFSEYLMQLFDEYMSHELEEKELASWTGPYRAVVESLNTRYLNDRQVASAEGFIITQWSKVTFWGGRAFSVSPETLALDYTSQEVAVKLPQSLSAGKWSPAEEFENISSTQCRLAYALIIMNMGFCRARGHLLKILFQYIHSDQITVRTRSLKSVTQMLEKDPTLLDREKNFIRLIVNCMSDSSSMVRDSALALIGKCIVLKPALAVEVCKSLISCTNDTAVGIRKRSMRLLKDLYCRDARKDLRPVIAESLLQRARDADESVSELAHQMFEEMWLSPFWAHANSIEQSVQFKIALQEQVVLLIKTVQRSENAGSVLESLLSHIMSKQSKNVQVNIEVSKSMVSAAFEGMIDSGILPDHPDQKHILQTLTVFAKASPSLFTQSQIEHLQPYISNVKTADEVGLFRSVVMIIRHVLPTLNTSQQDFLKAIQDDLLKNVSKLAKAELNEVVMCLWTINHGLHNIDRLINLTISVLKQLHSINHMSPNLSRFIYLASHFGKHCNFEPHFEKFRKALPAVKGPSVVDMIVDSIIPFVSKDKSLAVRSVGFDAIGMLCQAWPKVFNRSNITIIFQNVLREDHADIQRIVLSSFRDFFTSQDQQVSTNPKPNSSGEAPLQNGKLGASLKASDNDGAAALIAQGFLKDILRIALASQDSYALAATQVIASISRQGLVHPKECGPALVALETSTNPQIAEVAFQEHRSLHQQHESTFEREYMRAIQGAFAYQKDVVGDPLGATGQPLKPKLRGMFEIIKTSKGKYQAKLLSNFCYRVDFELAKLDVVSDPPVHLQYARFLIENLALFEYGRVDDVQQVIAYMEKIVGGTGAGVAHAINTEVFQVRLNPNMELLTDGQQEAPAAVEASTEISFGRLRQLSTASMILTMLWEARTHLCRLYGLNQQRRDTKSKASAKDLNKAPTKLQGFTADKFMDATAKTSRALQSQDSMISQCKEFAELLSIDNEVKVPADAEDDVDGRPTTPSVDEEGDTTIMASGGSKNSKRKGSVSVAGTPHKKKRGRPLLEGRKKSGKGMDEEDDS